jgi:hypothetical protein
VHCAGVARSKVTKRIMRLFRCPVEASGRTFFNSLNKDNPSANLFLIISKAKQKV